MLILLTIISIIIIFICSLFENNYLAFRKPIVWSDSMNLSWNYFKGLTKPFFLPNTEYQNNDENIQLLTHAHTESKIIKEKLSDDSTDLKIYTVFYPGKSFYYFYTDDKTTLDEGLLKHEIYHFHIDEISSRFLKSDLFNKKMGTDNRAVSKIFDDNNKLMDDMQLDYDSVTRHGTLKETQFHYQKIIDSILKVTDYFKEPIIKNIKITKQ
jgi:hypothetical protein